MARSIYYHLRLSEEERQMLAAVAEKLQRKDTDVIRLLVAGAAEHLVNTAHNTQKHVAAVSGNGGGNGK